MEALRVDNVKKSFRCGLGLAKRQVLQGVSLIAMPAEVLGFLGPNGAGKTTTIKIVLGLERADEGKVAVFGEPAGSKTAASRIGYLPEMPYFHPNLSLEEFLSFCGRLCGMGGRKMEGRIFDVLEKLELVPHRRRRLKEFSKGMLQRAGIAQTMLHDPDLYILDEPFSGLDPLGRKLVRDILVDLKSQGKTIFFSSHILPDMETLCDRVCIIREGSIVKTLALDELMRLGEGKVEITARSVSQSAISSLSEYIEKVSQRGEETFLVVREQRYLRSVISHLYEHGADVMEVSNQRRSLEDIFVEVISRSSSFPSLRKTEGIAEQDRERAVFAGF